MVGREETRDVFVSHASEDKDLVVRPLVTALKAVGITVWFDEAEIRWGDTISGRINEGLRISRFVVVILSCSFLGKKWPERELQAAIGIETSTGEVRVLPILVGSREEREAILKAYPLLNDRLYLPWDRSATDPRNAAERLSVRLGINAAHVVPGSSARKNPPTTMRSVGKGHVPREIPAFQHYQFGSQDYENGFYHAALRHMEIAERGMISPEERARCLLKMARAAYVVGDYGRSRIWALRILKRLVRDCDLETRIWAYIRYGDALRKLKDTNTARHTYRKLLRRYLPDDAFHRERSVVLERIGDIQYETGKPEDAHSYYDEDVGIRLRLWTHRNDGQSTRDLVVALRRAGDALLGMASLEKAFVVIEKARSYANRLVLMNPGNPGWRWDSSCCLISQGRIEHEMEHYQNSFGCFSQALEQLSEARRLDGANPRILISQVECRSLLSREARLATTSLRLARQRRKT